MVSKGALCVGVGRQCHRTAVGGGSGVSSDGRIGRGMHRYSDRSLRSLPRAGDAITERVASTIGGLWRIAHHIARIGGRAVRRVLYDADARAGAVLRKVVIVKDVDVNGSACAGGGVVVDCVKCIYGDGAVGLAVIDEFAERDASKPKSLPPPPVFWFKIVIVAEVLVPLYHIW